MITVLQRYFIPALFLLTVLCGMALGQLGATVLGIRLRPTTTARPTPAVPLAASAPSQLADYEVIVRRNLFDASRPNLLTLTTPVATAGPRANFSVLGTVTAGSGSLALIQTERETKAYRLGRELPGVGTLIGISRTTVRIRRPDGSEETALLKDAPRLATLPEADAGDRNKIRLVGENRFVIPRQEVEKARANINELLKQARLEPNITGGQTRGFVVRMIRPESILASLGLRLGDLVMQVNDVRLDSPEKALQIFQQLREARHISLALERGGSPMSLEYDLD